MQTLKKRIIASHIKIKTKMKVKNLLLAGLAVAAMTACSNDEIIDNDGIQTKGENAAMQINFQFPTTRVVSDGGTNAGIDIEYAATEITAVLEYTETNKRIVVKGLTFGQQTESGARIYSTEKFQVEAGNNVKVYAFINPIMEIPTTGLENLKVGKQKLPSEGLDYIAETIAKSGNFMMSNVNGEPTVIKAIVGGTDTNTANISVERISAKLTEETKRSIDNKYELTTPTFVGPKVYVQILSHTYTNLADDSYVLGGRNAAWSSFLHPYKTGEVSETDYRWLNATGTTYVLENLGSEWNTATSTSVLYQGQVFFENDGNQEIAGTFYSRPKLQSDGETWKVQIYKNWEELCADVDLTGIGENDDVALANRSIMRYAGGKCYYQAPIEHFGVGANIARNNWYQLKVTSIADLGYPKPVPPTPENETKLMMSVTIAPWTIHINNVGL